MNIAPKLPSAEESEHIVIGSIFLDNTVAPEIVTIIHPDDFFNHSNSIIYAAIIRLMNKSIPIDIGTVVEELKISHELTKVGGPVVLSEMLENVLAPSSALNHAQIIRDKSIKRGLINSAMSIRAEAFDDAKSGEEIVGEAANKLVSLSDKSTTSDSIISIREMVEEGIKSIDKRVEGGKYITGISTGIEWLDLKTSGMQPAEFWMLAARPSRGKSVFCEQLLFHAARNNHPSLFFSLEMSKQMIVDRLMARLCKLDLNKIRSGRLTSAERAFIRDTKGLTERMPYYIDATPGLNINQIRNRARMSKLRYGIELIGVDYLLLIDGARRYHRDSEESELRHTLQGLKNMARELNIPVLILNQLNRDGVDGEPGLQDIKGTGANEAEPDIVLFLHRPGFEDVQEQQPEMDEAILKLAKGRNCGTGRTTLNFWGKRVTLEDPAGVPKTSTEVLVEKVFR